MLIFIFVHTSYFCCLFVSQLHYLYHIGSPIKAQVFCAIIFAMDNSYYEQQTSGNPAPSNPTQKSGTGPSIGGIVFVLLVILVLAAAPIIMFMIISKTLFSDSNLLSDRPTKDDQSGIIEERAIGPHSDNELVDTPIRRIVSIYKTSETDRAISRTTCRNLERNLTDIDNYTSICDGDNLEIEVRELSSKDSSVAMIRLGDNGYCTILSYSDNLNKLTASQQIYSPSPCATETIRLVETAKEETKTNLFGKEEKGADIYFKVPD